LLFRLFKPVFARPNWLRDTAATPIEMETMMKKTMIFAMTLALALPAAAIAQTQQVNPNFSQGKSALVLSDGAVTGYNSAAQR